MRRAARMAVAALAVGMVGMASTAALADSLPTGGVVVAGSGTIAQAGTVMTVTQATARMAADWQSFNIGAGNTVNFVQPSSTSVALNRVLGSDVSVIQGALNANGQVFLVNPNGVLFTPTAQVNVGSIVASTLAISTADFMAGSYKFAGDSSNAIINQGNITTINGGSIALIAAKITNTGTLTANAGNVLLGAGSQVTLDLGGPVKLQVTQGAIDALIENGGAIKADGGLVYLTARAAGDLATSVINNTGVIEARGLVERDGRIVLESLGTGIVANRGTLDASSASGKGGSIQVLGDKVGLFDGTRINASGDTGGGTVLIGGDFQGSNHNIQNASMTYVGKDVQINADAITHGDGGRVIVWADNTTRFYGNISARGGAQSGDGGFVEISGKENLLMRGSVDTRAPHGKTGALLLDPGTINITDAALDTGTLDDELTANSDGALLAAVADDGLNTVSRGQLEAFNATTNIILEATGLITIENMAGNLINLATGTGNSFTLRSTTSGGIEFVDAADEIRTVGGAIILRAQGTGNLTNIGKLTTAGGAITLENAGTTSTVAGVIAGTGTTLTKEGTGKLTLSGANTYTGLTTVNAGILSISNNTGLGTTAGGVIVASKASLELQNNITVGDEALTISGTGSASNGALRNLSGSNTYGGLITLAAAATIKSLSGQTLTVSNTGTITGAGFGLTLDGYGIGSIASIIGTGTGTLTKTEPGTWTLSGANTYSGGTTYSSTTISAGTLTVDGASAKAGTGTIAVGANTLNINNGATLDNAVTITSGTIGNTAGAGTLATGGVTLNGAANLSSTGAGLTVSAVIANGTGTTVTKTGASTVTLSGANTYTGLTTVSAGTLSAANATALGTTAAGTTVTSGASLLISSVSIGNEAVTINGTGVSGAGSLRGSGTASLSGALTANTSSTVGGSGSLTLGAISVLDGQSLTLGTAAALNLTTGSISGVASGSSSNLTVNTTGSVNMGVVGTDIGAVNITAANTILSTITADTIALTDSGASGATLNGVLTANASNNSSALVIRTSKFTNSYGAGALSTPNGSSRWLVYSTNADPFNGSTGDTRNGLVYSFKQYNTSYGGTIQGSGNGLIYSYAPTVTAGLTGTVSKTYDGTTSATLATGNYSISGAVDGDTVTLNNPASGNYDTQNVGSSKTVIVTGASIASVTNGAATVYGYGLASNTVNGNVGSITAKVLTITGMSATSRVYDGSLVAALTGGTLATGITGEALTFTGETGAFADKNVATGKAVTVTGTTLGNGTGGLASNYSLTQPTATTANISARTLSVTATGSNKVYDGLTTDVVSLSDNRVTNDVLTLTNSAANFTDKNVATGKTVNVTGINVTGTDAANYSFNTTAATTANISPRPITLMADAKTKIYGNTDPALTYQITTGNLVGSDTFTGALTRSAGENVGSYTINAAALANSNYQITASNGAFTIEKNLVVDNAVRSAQAQVSTGTNAVAAGSTAAGSAMPSPRQSAGLSLISSQPTSPMTTNISLSGGLAFVQVPDEAANTPAATGSAGGVALAALSSSGGTDTSGFMRVFVVAGGINLGQYSKILNTVDSQ